MTSVGVIHNSFKFLDQWHYSPAHQCQFQAYLTFRLGSELDKPAKMAGVENGVFNNVEIDP